MRRGRRSPRAVVADRRALERNLVRFLLQEEGYAVVAEAAMGRDIAHAVEEHRPDVVVLNDNVAFDRNESVVAAVRRTAPSTRVVLITERPNAVPRTVLDEVDAIVEEGVGLQELGSAVAGTATIVARPDEPIRVPTPDVPSAPRVDRRWFERFQGAAAASIVVLGAVMAIRLTGDPVLREPPGAVRVHLATAYRSLDALAHRATTATPGEVASLARTLLEERTLALASGADVTSLDDEIAEQLAPLLPSMSPDARDTLVAILGGLVVDDAPPPTPTTSPPSSDPPAPSPTVAPEPAPQPSPTAAPPSPAATAAPPPSPTSSPEPEPTLTESPAPEPTPTGTPTPAPTPTATPTDTPTPSPTAEPTPTDTPTPSSEPTPTGAPTVSPTTEPSPTPTASETPTASPTSSPSGTPTASGTPIPSPTAPAPTPTPAPPPTPAPSPTPSASPPRTETVTPAETDTAPSETELGIASAGSAVLVPGGAGTVLVVAAIGRRRANRS